MVKPTLSDVVLSGDKRDLSFVLRGASLPLANNIVRVLQKDVKTVAMEEDTLEVVTNTGALNDSMLLSRLALVPIHFDLVEVDGYARENYTFVLRAACPKDRAGLDVTSRDIKALDADGRDLGTKVTHRLFPVDPVTGDGILLARLRPGEEIYVKGPAICASGEQHAGFCPVSRVGISHVRDEAAVKREAAAIQDPAAKQAFLALGADRVTERDADGEPCAFRIQLRSECGIPPKELVRIALLRLRARVGRAAKAVADGEVPAAPVPSGAGVGVGVGVGAKTKPSGADLVELTFETGEDSTLGELMQYHVLKSIGDATAFVGYDSPHPLSERLLFRMPAERYAERFQKAADAAAEEVTRVMDAVSDKKI